MIVELIRYTPEPEELIAEGFGICTGKDTIPLENIPKFMEMGHMSPVEHASATFRIEGVSRACSHQLVRHRIASFSQRSQRYCLEDGWSPIVPDSVTETEERWNAFNVATASIRSSYQSMVAYGVPEEDARFILPNATPTGLLMTANFREFLHLIDVRLSPHAQWEIRDVARRMLDQLHVIAPHVFGNMLERRQHVL